MFNKKTIRDIDLKGKTVLLRVDYNVLYKGQVSSELRLTATVPTIEYLLKNDCKIVLLTYAGRPAGKVVAELSLKPVAKRLAQILGRPVGFITECVGPEVKTAVEKLKPKELLLLENVRFHPEEKANDAAFAKQLAGLADVFVEDAFGQVHRNQASVTGITRHLPSVAGLLLEQEVATITKVMKDPEHPLVAVIGGAKIGDKIEVLNHFIQVAECVAVGGALANNFLIAEGYKVGKSVIDKGALEEAHKILASARAAQKKRPFSFLVPVDAVVSKSIDGTKPTRVVDLASQSLADIEAYPKMPARAAYSVAANELILDIGPLSAAKIAGTIKMARTVVWNGTMGVTETKGIAGADAPFGHGTRTIVEAMIGDSNVHANKPFSLVGGGDTIGYIEEQDLTGDFNHVSTGGGASLELMSGRKLPGVEALLPQ